ncbi:MAG: ABC transporter substrate-binding protein [Bacteriovoracaceae bacterium]|nr:ABC transporter substrate-binding protein [Bacteriovoracaceae bacterium]
MPYSADPADFDFMVHNVVFYSVFSPLVSEYKVGDIKGIIAESWRASSDFTLWKFKIRENLKFENGDAITPEVVYKSLKRIGYILSKKKSHNGLFEFVKGFDSLANINSPFVGLRLEGNEIIFDLVRPIKNMLSLVSFGMYSIVHPSLFDENSGEWKDIKQSISSSAYRVSKWDNEQLVLEKRSDYKSLYEINVPTFQEIPKIVIRWDPKFRNQSDLIYGTSDENLITEGREFFGGITSEIRFIRCVSWFVPGSPCYNLEDRRILRTYFYSNLKKLGFNVVRSFFPVDMQGIKEIPSGDDVGSDKKFNQDLSVNSTNSFNPIIKIGYIDSIHKLADKFALTVTYQNMNYGDLIKEVAERPKKTTVDISTNGSGIYIDKPLEDIQFMFKSKEGVNIPDTDGRIMEVLKNDQFDPQKVNELIWEQAAVWPIIHYAIGFWATKDKFDFSQINLTRVPTAFELIGTK